MDVGRDLSKGVDEGKYIWGGGVIFSDPVVFCNHAITLSRGRGGLLHIDIGGSL